jgi:hypothetical protein
MENKDSAIARHRPKRVLLLFILNFSFVKKTYKKLLVKRCLKQAELMENTFPEKYGRVAH